MLGVSSKLLQNKRHIVMAVNMKSWRNVGLVDKFDKKITQMKTWDISCLIYVFIYC